MDSHRAFIVFKELPISMWIFATQLQVHNLSIQFKTEELDAFYPIEGLTTMSKDAALVQITWLYSCSKLEV